MPPLAALLRKARKRATVMFTKNIEKDEQEGNKASQRLHIASKFKDDYEPALQYAARRRQTAAAAPEPTVAIPVSMDAAVTAAAAAEPVVEGPAPHPTAPGASRAAPAPARPRVTRLPGAPDAHRTCRVGADASAAGAQPAAASSAVDEVVASLAKRRRVGDSRCVPCLRCRGGAHGDHALCLALA